MTNDFNLQLQLYPHQKPFMISPNKEFGDLPTYFQSVIPEHKYMLKVNGSNARENCETWSKLTIKTPERRHQSVYVKVARELKEISTLRQCQSNYIVQKNSFLFRFSLVNVTRSLENFQFFHTHSRNSQWKISCFSQC